MPAMADWRQVQARIRKAKNSPDAPTKLHELYQRTHDAMVAWELGLVEEKAERTDEAVKWYTIAVERFRRSDWKKKAEEALTRLGAPLPEPGAKPSAEPIFASRQPKSEDATEEQLRDEERADEVETASARLALGEIADEEESDEPEEGESPAAAEAGAATNPGDADPNKKKRRRGRRGGRGRRRKGAPATPGLPAQTFAEPATSVVPPSGSTPVHHERPQHSLHTSQRPAHSPRPEHSRPNTGRNESYGRTGASLSAREEAEPRIPIELPEPMLPSERTAHGRAGDPALASRMAKLDSMLRRLVSSPLHKLDDSDSAPAGPGVFLLSDSDQISSYYVEACQTLRVGLGNLARGSGRSTTKAPRQGRPVTDSGLKTKLAEHLGIGEAKVAQYLKEHCVVRWIQLDDDAPHLAHFAISILRTPLNLD
jgi:hypothetical protein